MGRLVKQVRLNNLEYNPNRDPEVYRRVPDKPFRIQALLGGSGEAHATVEVDGITRCEQNLKTPGTFSCEIQFDTPGVRVAMLLVKSNGETFQQSLRLDVVPHEWIG